MISFNFESGSLILLPLVVRQVPETHTYRIEFTFYNRALRLFLTSLPLSSVDCLGGSWFYLCDVGSLQASSSPYQTHPFWRLRTWPKKWDGRIRGLYVLFSSFLQIKGPVMTDGMKSNRTWAGHSPPRYFLYKQVSRLLPILIGSLSVYFYCDKRKKGIKNVCFPLFKSSLPFSEHPWRALTAPEALQLLVWEASDPRRCRGGNTLQLQIPRIVLDKELEVLFKGRG